MTPDELSQLCLKRILSGDHMRYFIKIANQQEPEILYVYVNPVRDINRFVDQQLMIKQGNIKHLVMILHIGKKRTNRDGKPLSTVFISDDNTVAVILRQLLLICLDSLVKNIRSTSVIKNAQMIFK